VKLDKGQVAAIRAHIVALLAAQGRAPDFVSFGLEERHLVGDQEGVTQTTLTTLSVAAHSATSQWNAIDPINGVRVHLATRPATLP
jgi:hypothetical protein